MKKATLTKVLTPCGVVFFIILMFASCTKYSPNDGGITGVDPTVPLVTGFSKSGSNTSARSDAAFAAVDTGQKGEIIFIPDPISEADEKNVLRVEYTVINGVTATYDYTEYRGFTHNFIQLGKNKIVQRTIFIDTTLIAEMELWITDVIIVHPGEQVYVDSCYFSAGDWLVDVFIREDKLNEGGYTDHGYRQDPPDWGNVIAHVFPSVGNGYVRLTLKSDIGDNKFTFMRSTSGDIWGDINPDSARVWWRGHGIGKYVLKANGTVWNSDTTVLLFPDTLIDPVNLGTPLHPNVYYKPIFGTDSAYLHIAVSTMPDSVLAGYVDNNLLVYYTTMIHNGFVTTIIPRPAKRALPFLYLRFEGAEAEVNEGWDANRQMLAFQITQ